MLKVLVTPFLLLSFSLAAFAADKDDGDSVQGTWLPMSAELAGAKFPDSVRQTIKLVVNGDKYIATVGKDVDRGR